MVDEGDEANAPESLATIGRFNTTGVRKAILLVRFTDYITNYIEKRQVCSNAQRLLSVVFIAAHLKCTLLHSKSKLEIERSCQLQGVPADCLSRCVESSVGKASDSK